MFRMMRFWSLVVFFIIGMLVVPALASTSLDGTQKSGAVYRIYFPDKFKDWNGDLIVFAHSYVPPADPDTPPEIQNSELSIEGKDGNPTIFLPDLFTEKGYAFAVTSYSKTGLAVVQGVADVVDLAGIFKANWGNPKNVYLVGLSQGGLVCTLALEQHPEVFSGGLSLCGPIGDFRRQINYWGDFRAVFDYFFPGLIPGSAVGIPTQVIQNWPFYEQQVIGAVSTNPEATSQLLKVARAAADPNNPMTVLETVIGLLRYNVFATNDGKRTLNGQPFDNFNKYYSGSNNDDQLNQNVMRFEASPTALAEIQAHYETSGLLVRPLVSMHTTYDPVVPFWHEALYQGKILQNGSANNYLSYPVPRYGHVNFTADEVLDGFARLVGRVNRTR